MAKKQDKPLKIDISEDAALMAFLKTPPPHPYKAYEGTQLWKSVERAIADLVSNQDLKELERREYIVGYICKIVSAPERKNRPTFEPIWVIVAFIVLGLSLLGSRRA